MKIALVGSQCVGKTTFIEDIIEACPQFSRETYTYRDAIKEAGVENKINRKTCAESQRIIFNALAECVKRAEPFTILDRSVMDAVAYTTYPVLRASKTYTDITQKMLDNMTRTAIEVMNEYDLIVYIPVDENIAIEADTFRDVDPQYRLDMAKIFEDLLLLDIEDPLFDKYGYKVATISGTREERVSLFKELITTL